MDTSNSHNTPCSGANSCHFIGGSVRTSNTTVAYPMEQAFHTTHIDNDDDQILIASWNPTRNAPYHCYRLVVPEYVKTRKTDLINNEIRDSCNKSELCFTCLDKLHSNPSSILFSILVCSVDRMNALRESVPTGEVRLLSLSYSTEWRESLSSLQVSV